MKARSLRTPRTFSDTSSHVRARATTGPDATFSPVAASLVEPLSPQEQRVLRLLAAGLSNAEIAQQLIVSVNTIKTQLKSIYRKLDVRSRDDARSAARDLDLL